MWVNKIRREFHLVGFFCHLSQLICTGFTHSSTASCSAFYYSDLPQGSSDRDIICCGKDALLEKISPPGLTLDEPSPPEPVERSTEKITEKSTEKTTEKPTEKTTEKAIEKSTESSKPSTESPGIDSSPSSIEISTATSVVEQQGNAADNEEDIVNKFSEILEKNKTSTEINDDGLDKVSEEDSSSEEDSQLTQNASTSAEAPSRSASSQKPTEPKPIEDNGLVQFPDPQERPNKTASGTHIHIELHIINVDKWNSTPEK